MFTKISDIILVGPHVQQKYKAISSDDLFTTQRFIDLRVYKAGTYLLLKKEIKLKYLAYQNILNGRDLTYHKLSSGRDIN